MFSHSLSLPHPSLLASLCLCPFGWNSHYLISFRVNVNEWVFASSLSIKLRTSSLENRENVWWDQRVRQIWGTDEKWGAQIRVHSWEYELPINASISWIVCEDIGARECAQVRSICVREEEDILCLSFWQKTLSSSNSNPCHSDANAHWSICMAKTSSLALPFPSRLSLHFSLSLQLDWSN